MAFTDGCPLAALMTYRTAADVLEQMFPVGTGNDKETMAR
jgi:hypothetical protein